MMPELIKAFRRWVRLHSWRGRAALWASRTCARRWLCPPTPDRPEPVLPPLTSLTRLPRRELGP